MRGLSALAAAAMLATVVAASARAEECDPPFASAADFTRCTDAGTLGLSARDPRNRGGRVAVRPLGRGETEVGERDTLWLSVNGAVGADAEPGEPAFVAVLLVGVHTEAMRAGDRSLSVHRNRNWVRPGLSSRPLRFSARGFSKDFDDRDLDGFAALHAQDDVELVAEFLGGHQLHGRPASHLAGSWDVRSFFARRVGEIPECRAAAICDLRVRLLPAVHAGRGDAGALRRQCRRPVRAPRLHDVVAHRLRPAPAAGLPLRRLTTPR